MLLLKIYWLKENHHCQYFHLLKLFLVSLVLPNLECSVQSGQTMPDAPVSTRNIQENNVREFPPYGDTQIWAISMPNRKFMLIKIRSPTSYSSYE
jgi:hypothetical protein